MGDATETPTVDVKHLVDRSVTVGLLRRAIASLQKSRLAAATRWFGQATRASFCYRWLTAEPEPAVIVIDLRETRTVGPIIAVLDRLVIGLLPAWQASWLKVVSGQVVGLLEAAVETRPGRALVSLLEPPEPPDGEPTEYDQEDGKTPASRGK